MPAKEHANLHKKLDLHISFTPFYQFYPAPLSPFQIIHYFCKFSVEHDI